MDQFADHLSPLRYAVERRDAGGQRAQVGLERAGVQQYELVLGELVEQEVDERVGIAPSLAHRALVDPGAPRDPLGRQRLIAVLDEFVPGRGDDCRAHLVGSPARHGRLHAVEDRSQRRFAAPMHGRDEELAAGWLGPTVSRVPTGSKPMMRF